MNKNYESINISTMALTPIELKKVSIFHSYEKHIFLDLNFAIIKSYANRSIDYRSSIFSGEERFQINLSSISLLSSIFFWNNNFFLSKDIVLSKDIENPLRVNGKENNIFREDLFWKEFNWIKKEYEKDWKIEVNPPIGKEGDIFLSFRVKQKIDSRFECMDLE